MNPLLRLFCGLLIIISSALSSEIAHPTPADVEEICGRNYFTSVHQLLQKAGKSIYVVMYFINFDPSKANNVSVLVNDLVTAHKQGVKVKVILDRNMQYAKGGVDDAFDVEEKNQRAFDFLKEAGVEVYYDNINTITHAKAIVVDDSVVIVGSTNWSASSLDRNNETAVLVNSPEIAKKFIDYCNSIAIDNEESNKKAVSYITLSEDILKGPLARFIKTDNKGCWNLYMYLIRQNTPGVKIDFDHSLAQVDVGIKGDMDRYRARINEDLKALDKEFGLIEAKVAYGKNAEVVLKPLVETNKPYFEIPKTFWEYGWNKRLSLAAQYCLFIQFMESGPNHQKWFQSKKNLAKEFNISDTTISNGMLELKRWNLIDTEWGTLEEGFADRPANRYRLKNLYSTDDFNAELDKLKGRYGADNLGKAVEFAKIVLDEYNLEHIEDIAVLINENGIDKVKSAFDKVSKYKVGNPMRTLRYVAGIVRTEEQEK